MNNSQIELQRILHDMDQLQTERRPLQPHFAVALDTHTRERYATMLAALVLADGEVSENASRLLKMLLTSLDLGDVRARLFELAHALDQDSIREFCRVVDAAKLQESFVLDALILCRIDGPLSAAKSRLLSELVELICLPEIQLPELVHLAAMVLRLPSEVTLGSL